MAKIEADVIKTWVKQLQEASELERLAATSDVVVRTRGAVRTRGVRKPAPAQASGDDLERAVEALQREQSPDVRREVVLALGQVGGVGEVKTLSRIARSDSDPTVRAIAVEALGKIGGTDAFQVLRESALQDGHEIVRARAVAALGELAIAAKRAGEDPAPAVKALVDIRDTDRSSYVRDIVLETLATVQ
jgi:HEAT repeat protein